MSKTDRQSLINLCIDIKCGSTEYITDIDGDINAGIEYLNSLSDCQLLDIVEALLFD